MYVHIWRKDLGHTSFFTLPINTYVYVCIYVYVSKKYVYIYILLLSLKLPSVILFPSPLKVVSGLKNTETIELGGLSSVTISRSAGASAAFSVGQEQSLPLQDKYFAL